MPAETATGQPPDPVGGARPPTIRDVARAAGVSVGTASKALNGRGRLRAETRQRVLAEAARLEFRPNDLVRSLLRGRTYTVGLLTSDYFGRFNMPVAAGVADALGAAAILVFVCAVGDDPARERAAIEGLLAKQVDGIVVTGRRLDPRPPVCLGRARTPVVYAYALTTDPDALCVIPDDAQGGHLAADHLLRQGRRRLAHITGPDYFLSVGLRRDGMRQALAAHGLAAGEARVLYGPWAERWGYEAARRLLAEDRRLDALFCGSDQLARGALDALREDGVLVPDDVAVVGFDNWEVMAEAARPPLTTVEMHLETVGREASTRLLAIVAGQRESGVIRLPCSLVVRGSCGSAGAEEERPGVEATGNR